MNTSQYGIAARKNSKRILRSPTHQARAEAFREERNRLERALSSRNATIEALQAKLDAAEKKLAALEPKHQ